MNSVKLSRLASCWGGMRPQGVILKQTSGVINALPLWALYIFTATIVLLSDEAGWRLGSYRRKRSEQEIKAPIGGIVGAIFGVLGYQFGLNGVRSWPTTILMVLIFTSIIVLISDLDRPQAGLVQMSQQAMIDLLNKMGAPVP